jgi:hypothetical protein
MGCVSETRVRALRVAAETVGSAIPAKRQMIAPLSLTVALPSLSTAD